MSGAAAPGLIALGVGNLIPLAGVLLWGWDLASILVMYWIETGVVGAINVLKIRKALALGAPIGDADGEALERPITRAGGSEASGSSVLGLIWLLSYGFFWAILGIFVLQIANGGFYRGASRTGFSGPSISVIAFGTLSLVGGQLFAYFRQYVLGRRYLTVTSLELLRDPFVRIFVILATIAAGGAGIAMAGSPVGLLGAMVAVKTAVEIWFARMPRRV